MIIHRLDPCDGTLARAVDYTGQRSRARGLDGRHFKGGGQGMASPIGKVDVFALGRVVVVGLLVYGEVHRLRGLLPGGHKEGAVGRGIAGVAPGPNHLLRATVECDGRVKADAFLQGFHEPRFDGLERVRVAAVRVRVVAVDVRAIGVLSRMQGESVRVHQGQHVEGVGRKQAAHPRVGRALAQKIVGNGQDRLRAGGLIAVVGPIGKDRGRAGLAGCIDDQIGKIAALPRLAEHLVLGCGGQGRSYCLQVALDLLLIVIGQKIDGRQLVDRNASARGAAAVIGFTHFRAFAIGIGGAGCGVCDGQVRPGPCIHGQVGGRAKVRGQVSPEPRVRRLVRAAAVNRRSRIRRSRDLDAGTVGHG